MHEVRNWIESFVHEKMSAEASRSQDAELEGVTLFGTIGASFHLRADGTVWINEWERDSSDPDAYQWREATAQEAAGAIKRGAMRMPELSRLLPQKGASPACPACQGS